MTTFSLFGCIIFGIFVLNIIISLKRKKDNINIKDGDFVKNEEHNFSEDRIKELRKDLVIHHIGIFKR